MYRIIPKSPTKYWVEVSYLKIDGVPFWTPISDKYSLYGHRDFLSYKEASDYVKILKDLDRKVSKEREEEEEFQKNNPIVVFE